MEGQPPQRPSQNRTERNTLFSWIVAPLDARKRTKKSAKLLIRSRFVAAHCPLSFPDSSHHFRSMNTDVLIRRSPIKALVLIASFAATCFVRATDAPPKPIYPNIVPVCGCEDL